VSHLTAAQRGNIEILLQEKYTNKQIGIKLSKHPSSVGREIKKGLDGSGIYKPFVAQAAYATNRSRCKQIPKLDHPANHRLRSAVVSCIQKGWDPGQTAGRLHDDPAWKDLPTVVCAETIYVWIYTSAFAIAEKLYQYLRYGKKKRTKQKGRSSHRSKIPNRVSIHERPRVVDAKSRLGDWEGDSVVYTHLHAINTLNERMTSLVAFTKLTAALGIPVYFADPYSSWQRGANENSNRQLRAYLPKRSDIRKLTQKELDNIAWEMNNKPRKRLKWHTPLEVYDFLVQNPNKQLDLTQVAFGSRI